ncbi:hypothetical protein HZS_5252 [Henneguya salminicola]|nr:hypothetical protein HZS_5252 [Henneguya salminicola]
MKYSKSYCPISYKMVFNYQTETNKNYYHRDHFDCKKQSVLRDRTIYLLSPIKKDYEPISFEFQINSSLE